jgi:phosphoribosyl 1,2-cyclic phosphodiesterase
VRVLVDAGLSAKETARRLEGADLKLRDLTAILITHEHADHAGGAAVLARKLEIPVYATRGTLTSMRDEPPEELWRVVESGQAFRLGEDLWATGIAAQHDAAEPLVYSLEERRRDGARARAAVITDVGHAPQPLSEQLCDHDALVLEMNHDLRRLLDGPYPWSLKQRVRGGLGHLSNAQGAALLAATHHSKLRHVVLAHLSEENNTPDLALRAADPVLDKHGSNAKVHVASQAAVGEMIDLEPRRVPVQARQLALF